MIVRELMMWYAAARNRAIGGGIVRRKPGPRPPSGLTPPTPPKTPETMTTEEKLKPHQTEGFMAGYAPDLLNVTEREKGSFIRDQHEGGWQEYTPEQYA